MYIDEQFSRCILPSADDFMRIRRVIKCIEASNGIDMLVWIEDIINASKVIFVPLRTTFSQKRYKCQDLNYGQRNHYSPVWYSQCALYNWIALKLTTQKICPYYYACQKCISFSQGNPQKCDIWKVIKESFQILLVFRMCQPINY